MARTRAERRYKTALIKKTIWNRSEWKTKSEQDTRWKGCWVVPVDEEFINTCVRRALRNEGRWRKVGKKKTYGCGSGCFFCNPQLSYGHYLKQKESEKDEMDVQDIESYLLNNIEEEYEII